MHQGCSSHCCVSYSYQDENVISVYVLKNDNKVINYPLHKHLFVEQQTRWWNILCVRMSDGDVHHLVSSWGHSFSYFLQISDTFLNQPQPVSGTVQREGNWKLRKDEWKEEEKLTSKLNSDILDKKTSLFLDKVFKRSIMHFVLSDTSMFSVEHWGRTDVKYIKILTNIQDAVCRISKGAGKINWKR